MISKKIHFSIYFSSNFIKFIFFDFNHKNFDTSYGNLFAPFHSSVIQYHFYASDLFMSPRASYTARFNTKSAFGIYNHKNLSKLKKQKKIHLLRTRMPIGV